MEKYITISEDQFDKISIEILHKIELEESTPLFREISYASAGLYKCKLKEALFAESVKPPNKVIYTSPADGRCTFDE